MIIWTVETHAAVVRHCLQCLDTQQHLVRLVVFLVQIVAVARRHSLGANASRNVAQDRQGAQLFLDAMILKLDEIIVLPEDVLIPSGNRYRLLLVSLGCRLGDSPWRQADRAITPS